MRAFHSSLLSFICLTLVACSSGQATLKNKALPDPSPINYPEAKRGPTVMLTIIFKFKDSKTGEDRIQKMTTTGIVVAKNYVLTSATLVDAIGHTGEVFVAVPDYETRRHKFVSKSEIAAKSNSGLMLLKTEKDLPEAVVISFSDGPALSESVKTIDVLNESIPGVIHSGTVSLVLTDTSKFGYLLIDVSSSSSSVGCGVYDKSGNLIALVLGPSNNGKNLNWSTVAAISAKDIREFLDAQGVSYTTPPLSKK